MPKITFMPHKDLCPDGLVIEAEEGLSICDIALQNKIDIVFGTFAKSFSSIGAFISSNKDVIEYLRDELSDEKL